MGENRKTTSKAKSNPVKHLAEITPPGRPVLRLKNRGGAPKGNRNAWKTGRHCGELKQLRARVRELRARIAATLAQANVLIASR